MDASAGRRSLILVLLLAVVYLVIGLAFPVFASSAPSSVILWRRLAWLVSGVAFAAHICYEHFRLGSSTRTTATRASMAAAAGACGLAVVANVHGWVVGSSHKGALAIALVGWPLLTAVPAFLVAIVAAAVLNRWFRRS